MTADERQAFEAWWERKEQAEPMPPESGVPPSPQEFAAMGWQAATAVAEKQRDDEPLIDYRLRSDDEYRRLFITELHEQVTEATAVEREECAVVAEHMKGEGDGWREATAAAIRKRGEG